VAGLVAVKMDLRDMGVQGRLAIQASGNYVIEGHPGWTVVVRDVFDRPYRRSDFAIVAPDGRPVEEKVAAARRTLSRW